MGLIIQGGGSGTVADGSITSAKIADGTITVADLATATKTAFSRRNGQLGQYIGTTIPGVGFTNVTGVAGRTWLIRFVPSESFTVATMGFVVGTGAGSNDNCDIGIYNSALSTKLASSGSTAGKLNATGVQSLTLTVPLALTAGTTYYAGLSVITPFGGSAVSFRGLNLSVDEMNLIFGSTNGLRESGLGDNWAPGLPASHASMSASVTAPLLYISA